MKSGCIGVDVFVFSMISALSLYKIFWKRSKWSKVMIFWIFRDVEDVSVSRASNGAASRASTNESRSRQQSMSISWLFVLHSAKNHWERRRSSRDRNVEVFHMLLLMILVDMSHTLSTYRSSNFAHVKRVDMWTRPEKWPVTGRWCRKMCSSGFRD